MSSDPVRSSLWRHSDFRLLWAGDTVSQLGSYIGALAIPYLAVVDLHATATEMGVLTVLGTLGFLLVGLPAGALVDRHDKRRIMLTADVCRAGLLALIPLAAWWGGLQVWLVMVVALLVGVTTVFFDVAYQSYLPVLVQPDQVVDGNAKLQASQSVSQAAGPAIAGALLSRIMPAAVVAFNAVGYLLSALLVASIRRREPVPESAPEHLPMRAAIGEGLRFILAQPLLRRLVLGTGVANLFNSMVVALSVLYMATVLDLRPLTIGLVDTGAALGGLLGAVGSTRLARRVGEGGSVVLSCAVMMGMQFYWPLAGLLPAAPTLLVGSAVQGAAMVAFNVSTVSFRQRLCPPRLLGRVNATARTLIWGSVPLGALIGGLLGGAIGIRSTLWCSAVLGLTAIVPLATRRIAGLRVFPALADDAV